MPQKTTVRWVKKVGTGHDKKVLEWRDILAGFLNTNSEVNFLQYIRCHHRNNCEMLIFYRFIICH